MTIKKKSVSELKREAIVEASIEEFLEKGFQKANMDAIAQRANVSKRTVYNHFSSKDELFKLITLQTWEQGKAATHYPFNPELSVEVQLADIAQMELELWRAPRFIDLSRVLFGEFFHQSELSSDVMNNIAASNSSLNDWMVEAVSADALNIDDIPRACKQFTALLKAFGYWPQLMLRAQAPSEDEERSIIESAIGMFLNTYRA
jgi:TetR/AcrR family transcriptional regulator of autoinduction and epiphytic fitness